MEEAPEKTRIFLNSVYRGRKAPLFRMALLNALLTVITLGFYRFWAKTRVRKYFWSATAPAGDPLEYTGNGLEKLLGFLIAVAFLAVYLGLFQLFLGFAGLSLFSEGTGPADKAMQIGLAQVTILAVVPFIFYAQYRARRYILSRTRWRGIRFGVDADAWGYVWRAMGHWFLTIISLGLLLPRQTFWLEKYKIDRTWYGNARFQQGGNWPMLYRAMRHIFIGLAILAVFAGGIFFADGAQGVFQSLVLGIPMIFLGVGWLFYGYVYYGVMSFRLLAEAKTLDGKVGFSNSASPWKIFWRIVFGGMLTLISVFLVLLLAGGIGAALGFGDVSLQADMGGALASLDPVEIAYAIFVYLVFMGMFGVFKIVFITQPVLQHFVVGTKIQNADALLDIEQRSRDEMVEAEGFADALDVGAAI